MWHYWQEKNTCIPAMGWSMMRTTVQVFFCGNHKRDEKIYSKIQILCWTNVKLNMHGIGIWIHSSKETKIANLLSLQTNMWCQKWK